MKGLISNWTVKINEISMNVYKICGERSTGETFESVYDDPIIKLIELGIYAKIINNQYDAPLITPFFFPHFDTDLHEKISNNIEYILINEIMYDNYIQEYWTGYGSIIKLNNKLSRDSYFYIKKLKLIIEEKNDIHWGKNEISEEGEEWKILEPYYL